ncbi:MAG: endonuclease/exonuclease/phosphatase family protein [Solirubrobacteraceae bacterium]
MSKITTLLGITLATLATGVGASSAQAGILDGQRPLRAVTLNACGANPDCAARGGDANVAPTLRIADRLRPDAVALQEVCATQARRIGDGLVTRGYRHAFVVTKTDALGSFACRPSPEHGGHAAFGNLVAIRTGAPVRAHAAYLPRTVAADLEEVPVADLPSGSAEQRKVVCIASAQLRACSTHLVAGDDTALRERQARALALHVDGQATDGVPTVLAGDLNLTSREPGATALRERFRDAGAAILPLPTAGLRRIDYVLASRRSIAAATGTIFGAGLARRDDGGIARVSDHLGVAGWLWPARRG